MDKLLGLFLLFFPTIAIFAEPVLFTFYFAKERKVFWIVGLLLSLFASLNCIYALLMGLYGIGPGLTDMPGPPKPPIEPNWSVSLIWNGGIQLAAVLLQIPLFWYARRIKEQKPKSRYFLVAGFVCSAVPVIWTLTMIWPALTNQKLVLP